MLIKKLKKEAKNAKKIFLATDPDREGEAIAWHLIPSLKIEKNMSANLNILKRIKKTSKIKIFLRKI